MAAKAPDRPLFTRRYREGWKALSRLIHTDGSLSGRERNIFYLNLGDGRFIDVSGVTGLDFPEDGRAFAVLDLDHDGDLDLILKNRNSPQLRLLRNDTPTDNHSIAFRLEGAPANALAGFRSSRDAVGALIEIESPQGQRVKQVALGAGFLSQSSLAVYFGLRDFAGPVRATITWPSGRRQEFRDLPADHLISIREGASNWQAAAFRPRNFDRRSCAPQQPLKGGVRPEGYAFFDPIPTPPFALEDLARRSVSSAALRGRPLLLNLWATWCVPCQEEMRLWKQHYAEIQAAGAELVAVSVDEPGERSKVEQFVAERRLPFQVLVMDADTLRRYNAFYHGLFTRTGDLEIPTSFLLDPQGRLVKLYRGVVSWPVLEADLRALRQAPDTFSRAALPYPGRRFAGSFGRDYGYLGLEFVDRELFDDAGVYFETAVERLPSDWRSWIMLGLTYARGGELDRARQALERALALRPNDATGYFHLARVYALSEQPRLAEAAFARAAELDPEDPQVLQLFGEALTKDGKLEEARSVFRALLKLQPNDARAHNTLGVLYARTGLLFAAQESFARAAELQPDFADAFKNLGTAYLQARMIARAVPALERAVALRPDDADSHYLLAYAYAQTGRTAEAQRALDRVLQLRPDDPRARKALEELRPTGGGSQP